MYVCVICVLTLHVDVDVSVDVSDGAGGVTAIVAGVLLHQVGDDDLVGCHLES